MRAEYKQTADRDHAKYVNVIEHNISCNARSFWSFVNSKRSGKIFPSCLGFNGIYADTDVTVTNLFAHFFGSVYKESSNMCPSAHRNDSTFLLSDIYIDFGDVFNAINSLDIYKGAGLDGIPSQFFKYYQFIISRPLCNIFNKLLTTGIFPAVWKNSLIVPVFKSGSREDVKNYRTISILNVMPKIFERIITIKLSYLVK